MDDNGTYFLGIGLCPELITFAVQALLLHYISSLSHLLTGEFFGYVMVGFTDLKYLFAVIMTVLIRHLELPGEPNTSYRKIYTSPINVVKERKMEKPRKLESACIIIIT